MFDSLSVYSVDFDVHKLFLYLGICFFILYTLLNGISLDISYFSLILIYVGYFRVSLYSWVKYLFLLLIVVELLGYVSMTLRYFKNSINKMINVTKPPEKKAKSPKKEEPPKKGKDSTKKGKDSTKNTK
jgi:hypothetical protein